MKYSIGKRTIKDGISQWENINVDEYRITKPTVFCLGGNNTVNDKEANFMAKFVQRLIGESEDVDYLSLRYSNMPGFKTGYLSTQEEQEIVAKLFIPLVLDEEYNPLPCEQACKNMRKLTIMAHCFGAREAVPDLERHLVQDLLILGYDVEEIKKITRQVFVASFVGGETYFMSSFSIKSINDGFYADEYMRELVFAKLEGLDINEKDKRILTRFREKTKFSKDSHKDCQDFLKMYKYILLREDNQIDLLTANLSKFNDDHSITTLQRSPEWNCHYTSSKNGDIASQTIAYVLATSVANSLVNEEHDVLLPVDMQGLQRECEELLFDMRPQYIKDKLSTKPAKEKTVVENERKKEE